MMRTLYRDAAHQRALWAAWSLALDGRPMDLAELRRRLERETLLHALERHRGRDERISDWFARLSHQQIDRIVDCSPGRVGP
jgi:hypothetical protein